jgi:hypothetical protein
MRACQGIDQLPRDAHPRSRLAHRAFEHIAHAELAPDLFHVDGTALVCVIKLCYTYTES